MTSVKEIAARRKAKKTFTVVKRDVIGYDVWCKFEDCSFVSSAWDFHANALSCGFGHAHAIHGEPTERGAQFVKMHGRVTVGAA